MVSVAKIVFSSGDGLFNIGLWDVVSEVITCDGEVDECGICNGDNLSCADCAGIPGGSALIDECGICDGNSSPPCFDNGDVNLDGSLDVTDIVLMVGFILNTIEPSEDQLLISDMNQDGVLNVLDVTLLLSIILNN